MSNGLLRRCLLLPVSEHAHAAELLSQAADALLRHDIPQAARLIAQSNFPALNDYRRAIVGPLNYEIHRQTRYPVYERVQRDRAHHMPGAAITRNVLERDGYRCRFCSSRVIVKEARRVFMKAFPDAVKGAGKNTGVHAAIETLKGSIDHLLPFQRRGNNDLENLVTACSPCQFGRAHFLLAEVEIEDPRKYPPINDSWDGLVRLRGFKADSVADAI